MKRQKYNYTTELGFTRRVELDKALSQHEHARCGVDFVGRNIQFISYSTTVIFADRLTSGNEYYISCTGTYSQTTRKHINWFLREYFPELSYQDMKRIAETGEVLTVYR